MYDLYDNIVLDSINVFSKRYPDKSHEYVNKLILSLWQEIAKMSQDAAEELGREVQEKININSDKSKWSDLSLAFSIVYFRYYEVSLEEIRKVLDAVANEFEGKTMEEAMELLREPDL